MAPAIAWPQIGAEFLQNIQQLYPDASNLATPVVTAENRALLEREILQRCDGIDGVEEDAEGAVHGFDVAVVELEEAFPVAGRELDRAHRHGDRGDHQR